MFKKIIIGLAGIWTRIIGFKVQSANHYTTRPQFSTTGLEPVTQGTTVPCSTNWAMLSLYIVGFEPTKHIALDLESNPFDRSGICTYVNNNIRKNLSMAGFEPAAFRLEV